jgi:hypothetical protein
MLRFDKIQNELASLRKKFEKREAKHESEPLATKADLDDAVSQVVDAVQDVENAVTSGASKESSTTFPVILPAHYKPR